MLGMSSLSRRAAFPWLNHPLVKSRKIARIRRNLHRFLRFGDDPGFIEIGFIRRIFADFAQPAHQIFVAIRGVGVDRFRLLETIVLDTLRDC